MKHTITIEVEYEDDDADDAVTRTRELTKEIHAAIGEGILAPYHTNWEVATFAVEVRHDGDDDEYPTNNPFDGGESA